MPYLTPNTAPAGTVCRTIVIPDDKDWLAIVNGALLELTRAYNFEKYGDLTPEETAAYFFDLWDSFHDSECMVIPVGMITMFGMTPLPDKWLECDGAAVSRTTYADLFAKISTTFGAGNGTTTFNLPNYKSRVPIGRDGAVFIGGTGGEVTHTLTQAEMPAHHHTQKMRNGNAMLTAGGSTNRVSITSTTEFNTTVAVDTFDTGSGNAHNNMQPYLVAAFGIYAGV